MVAGPTSSADSVWVKADPGVSGAQTAVAVEIRCTDLEVLDGVTRPRNQPLGRNQPRLSANSSQVATVAQRCGVSTLPLFSPLSSSIPLFYPPALLFSTPPPPLPSSILPLSRLLCPPSLRFSPPPFPAPLLSSALPPPTANTRRACDTVTSLLVC